MIIEAREQIKSLLAIRGMTLKKLAQLLTEKNGKTCTLTALSNKLRRGTITYNEVMKITEILGFKISYEFE
ncbi:LLM class flavin-dependent oxidoreductase [bacterium]|nr:LLM class flavin-dependent oxidoreductase [bacterium]